MVVAAFILLDLKAPPKAPTASATPQPSPVVGLTPDHLQQVVVHARGKVLTVTRQSNAFTYSLCAEGQGGCQPQPADSARSVQFFQSIGGLRPTHVIYGAPDGLPAYGVDKASTAEIDVKGASNEQVTILVGIKTPDGVSYFLKRQDSQDVVAVAVGSIDQEVLSLVDTPPVPQPSPAPSSAVASPSP